MSNNTHQNNQSIFGDWTELKQSLDPSFNYLIFEQDVFEGNMDGMDAIITTISTFKQQIRLTNPFRDHFGCRCIFVVQLRSQQKNRILGKINTMKVPNTVNLYIYGRRPR